MWVQSLGWEGPLEEGSATYSSSFAWRIPRTKESGRQWTIGLSKNQTQLKCLQLASVAQSCPTLCDPMNPSMPGLPVHHHLLEFTQTHVHGVGDAIQPSHPLSSPSPAPNPSQHQSFPMSQLFT